jgi:thiamine biosynthesis protein ThiS
MRLTVNGEETELGAAVTVADLVAHYQLEPKKVAVEVNCDLVRRRDYGSTPLSEGDQVEIVTLVGGG